MKGIVMKNHEFVLPYKQVAQRELETLIHPFGEPKIRSALWLTFATYFSREPLFVAHDSLPEGQRLFVLASVNNDSYPKITLELVLAPQLSWIHVYPVALDESDLLQTERIKSKHQPCLELQLLLPTGPSQNATTMVRGSYDILTPFGRFNKEIINTFDTNLRLIMHSR